MIATVRHLGFPHFYIFTFSCHILGSCSFVPNFAKIGKIRGRVIAQNNVFNMASVRHRELKIEFWSQDFIVLIYFSVQFFLKKSDDISLKYSDITIFKMAVVRHLGFQIFKIFTFARHYSLI